jgi:hypothetical protein
MQSEKLDFGARANAVKTARPREKRGATVFPFNPVFADIYIEDAADRAGGEGDERARRAEEIAGLRQDDPVRELFGRMRRLAAEACRDPLSAERFRESVFIRQARFMADFEDDYQKLAPFSMYYPYYQMMSYEQLRTYFTWRKHVRRGHVMRTDPSYVFLYIYELINNVGVDDCADGLGKLLFIWREGRRFTDRLDGYMPGWLRDYYIVNDCPFGFNELLEREPLLRSGLPRLSDKNDFSFYADLSPYRIRRSAFYNAGNEKMIEDCFGHIVERLGVLLARFDLTLNDLIYDGSKERRWQPFGNAIFYMGPECMPKGERRVRLSGCEYRFANGRWTCLDEGNAAPNGKNLLGYVFKRMEQLLRRACKFKYKLSADGGSLDGRQLDRLLPGVGYAGLLAEIDAAVKEYYIDSRKTVVRVDESNLEKIRQNARITQEKLTVAEDGGADAGELMSAGGPSVLPAPEPSVFDAAPEKAPEARDVWGLFAASLEPVEAGAVKKILEGASAKTLFDYAKENCLMLEVLLDNINRKALDAAGDAILEFADEIFIYDDYIERLRKAMKSE